MIFVNLCLVVAARARAWLPLALLAGALLFLGTIASDMSLLITAETDHFPDVILGLLWIGHRLSPPISSRQEVLYLHYSGTCSSRGGVHWFVFWGSKWCPSSLLSVARRLEFLQPLFESFLASFQIVTFELNVQLDLSRKATTKSLRSLCMKLLLKVLSESTWTMAVWMIRGDEGMGAIPGVRGGSGESLEILRNMARLTQELRLRV